MKKTGDIKGIYISENDIKPLFDFINELEEYKIRCEKVKTYINCEFFIKNASDIHRILTRIEDILNGRD